MHELLRSHGFVRRAKEADDSLEESESIPDQAGAVSAAEVKSKARAAAIRRKAKTAAAEVTVVGVNVDASSMPLLLLLSSK